HRAMRETNKVAIARFVMRSKQYLAAIRPYGELLALETLYFADEVRGADSVENLPEDVEVSDRELSIAKQLIESMATEWEPERYRDTYRERVLELIERKAQGEEIVVEPEAETPQVVDLMEALRASVEQAKQRGGKPPSAAARDDGEAAVGDDLSELSKEELYERASQAGIAGRSKMSKDELIAALTKKRAS
ncbi:MAG TPA: Ku protein, partial [Egibacteraceae bacterium]